MTNLWRISVIILLFFAGYLGSQGPGGSHVLLGPQITGEKGMIETRNSVTIQKIKTISQQTFVYVSIYLFIY